jgi:hypothetical protein
MKTEFVKQILTVVDIVISGKKPTLDQLVFARAALQRELKLQKKRRKNMLKKCRPKNNNCGGPVV